MKKIVLNTVLLFIALNIISQDNSLINIINYPLMHLNQSKRDITNSSFIRSTPFWNDDFSDPTTWTVTQEHYDENNNTPEDEPNGWTIDSNVDSWYLNAISSTSGGNFAELTNGSYDDVTGGTCPDSITYTITTSNAIDVLSLSGSDKALLSWEENGARFNDLQQVLVSIDNGNTWIEVANNLDYDVLSSAGGSPYNNPALREVNISNYIAANPSNVLVRFSWTTNYPNSASNNGAWITYGWMVDDVQLSLPEENDISNDFSFIYDENNFGAEYARAPINQISNNWVVGAQVSNLGALDQTNIVLNSDFGSFSTSSSIDNLLYDSTKIIQSVESITLSLGLYQGVFTVSSNEEQGGENFGNNVIEKNFEITEDVYSLDGLGIHPSTQETTSWIGPNSFPASQGPGILVCATGYPIQTSTGVSNVEFLLSSNTEANSEVILYILDSIDFHNGAFENSLFTSDSYTLTQQDVSTGKVSIPICDFEISPGYYYAALELSTSEGAFNIWVTDDLTVSQPAWSSAILIPGDQTVYTNGNAFAIRLGLGERQVSTGEDTQVVCDIYTDPLGQSYSQSGTYTYAMNNSAGCDSVVILNLTVNSPVTNYVTNLFCDSYIYDGQLYTTPNTFYENLFTIIGCDSLVVVEYSLNNSYGVDTQVACNSYTWINGNTYTSSNNSATYTIQNAAGCDSIVTLNLTINSNQFSTDFTVNQTIFLSPPFAAQFTNNTPNMSNYNFIWDFSDGTILQSNNPSVFHEFLNDGLYGVTLIAEDNVTGCTDTIYKPDFIYCTGGTSCTHAATIDQTGPINACLSDSVFLSCNTNPNYSYQWRLNGTYIPGAIESVYYPIQSGNYSVLISLNGCPEISADITVTIDQSLTAPNISSTGFITPCVGGTMTLSVPENYSSYNWSSGGTASSETITSSGIYFVTVANNSGCESTSPPFTVNASFITPPEVCIVGVNPAVNFNRVVWEKPLLTTVDSFYVYKETNQAFVYEKLGGTSYGDSAIFDDLLSNPAIQAYRYRISVVDSCGVESSLGGLHKTIHLTINQGVGNAWNLIWNAYEGIEFPSYNIYRGTSSSNMTLLTTIASNLNSYTDLSAPAGQLYYQIEVVSNYSCDPSKSYNTSRSNVVDNTQAPTTINVNKDNVVKVYPNPTNGEFTIDLGSYSGTIQTELFDISGRSLIKGGQEKMTLTNYPNGLYFLRVILDNKTEEIRLIKQ